MFSMKSVVIEQLKIWQSKNFQVLSNHLKVFWDIDLGSIIGKSATKMTGNGSKPTTNSSHLRLLQKVSEKNLTKKKCTKLSLML